MERANAEKLHMGLTNWRKAPDGKIEKSDVSIAPGIKHKYVIEIIFRNSNFLKTFF